MVVDTSIWIEWLIGGSQSLAIKALLPARESCVVPTIVQLELYKWLLREKGEEQADIVMAYLQKCQVIELTTSIALSAAEMHQKYKLATADAIVYATALHEKTSLLTMDAHFKELPHVQYLEKYAAK
jgi:predicted nucleic acid-binding protein